MSLTLDTPTLAPTTKRDRYLVMDVLRGFALLGVMLCGQIELLRTILHVVATPLIAAGSVCAIVLLFHGRSLRWLVKPFAPVGQMALTNYLAQSVAVLLILTSVGPGLGLAGNAGASTFVPLVLAVFIAQVLVSHVWMSVFAFGPAEWLWHALTYGTRPRILRLESGPSA